MFYNYFLFVCYYQFCKGFPCCETVTDATDHVKQFLAANTTKEIFLDFFRMACGFELDKGEEPVRAGILNSTLLIPR